jgi:hypothetical protein
MVKKGVLKEKVTKKKEEGRVNFYFTIVGLCRVMRYLHKISS